MRSAVVLSIMAIAWGAHAQTPPPAAPAGEAPAGDGPKPAAAYKVVEPRIVADYPIPSKADPRVCLEFPNQAQIIACANRYLPAKRKSG